MELKKLPATSIKIISKPVIKPFTDLYNTLRLMKQELDRPGYLRRQINTQFSGSEAGK